MTFGCTKNTTLECFPLGKNVRIYAANIYFIMSYRDVIDIDVLSQDAVNMYGEMEQSDVRDFVKTEHCQ